MFLSAYDDRSGRTLAEAMVTGAGSPQRGGRSGAPQVLDAGGGWYVNTWRDDVRRLVHRGTVTVLALRALPGNSLALNSDWRLVVGEVAERLGLKAEPWVAIRTGARSVALVTGAGLDKRSVAAVRAYVRTIVGARHMPRVRPIVPPEGEQSAGVAPTSNEAAAVARLNFEAPQVDFEAPQAQSPTPEPQPSPAERSRPAPHRPVR